MSRPSFPMTAPANATWRRQFDASRRQAAAWWAERTQRERRLLRIGALVLSLALVWMLGLKPAIDSISQSQQQLPRLRAETAQIDTLILEAQTLQRRQSGRMNASTLPEALQATLRRTGLETSATLNAGSADAGTLEWEVSITDASAARVMDWLASLPQLLHAKIQSVELSRSRIDGRDRPGQVSGRIVLQWPGEAGS